MKRNVRHREAAQSGEERDGGVSDSGKKGEWKVWPFSKRAKPQYPYGPTLAFPPSSTAVDKFLTLALASGLVSFSKLHTACADFDTGRTDEQAVSDLGNHLIAKQVFTEWQCDKLRQGKYKGFFFEGYRLLSRVGMDDTFSTYLGQRESTGRTVEIDVTPPTIVPLKDGRPHYIVREIAEGPHANNK